MNLISLTPKSYVNPTQSKGNSSQINRPYIGFKNNFIISNGKIMPTSDGFISTIPENELKIDIATKNDADKIANFIVRNAGIAEAEGNNDKYLIEEIIDMTKESMANGIITQLAKDEKGEIIGLLEMLAPENGIGFITSFLMDKSIKDKDIGIKFLDKAMQEARNSGNYAGISSFQRKSDIEKLFQKVGFREIQNEDMEEAKKKDDDVPEDLFEIRLNFKPDLSEEVASAWLN